MEKSSFRKEINSKNRYYDLDTTVESSNDPVSLTYYPMGETEEEKQQKQQASEKSIHIYALMALVGVILLLKVLLIWFFNFYQLYILIIGIYIFWCKAWYDEKFKIHN